MLSGKKRGKTGLLGYPWENLQRAVCELNPAVLAEHGPCAIAWFTIFFLKKEDRE